MYKRERRRKFEDKPHSEEIPSDYVQCKLVPHHDGLWSTETTCVRG